MSSVAVKVLSTINAPYGTAVSAQDLARRISDPLSAELFDAPAFCFFSEVSENLQRAFMDEMNVEPAIAADVARKFSSLAGYTLPLARAA